MVDLDFRSFSTRSFERFAQAMAQHVLGKGLLIFGDGPDGGREAAYDGTLSYPSESDRWSGYTIMQAKFLQVPGEPYQDADWLVGQLRDELEKFASPGSDLRKPDYYILVTNARLSGMPAGKRGAGGQAKIDAVFEQYRKRLSLRDWRVWHLDYLNSLLAGADALRRSYAAWLTGSDVIATLLQSLELKSQTFQDAMYRYLARELRSHQPIRLQQAGHGGDARTMIEDVFTDLPFRAAGGSEADGAERLLIWNLLEWSRDRLDADSARAQRSKSTGRPERILLLGGPGQGKSTVTQFLAQILRANMLRGDRQEEVSPETTVVVESTLGKAQAMGLEVSVPRRFPFRVDLPNFADALSSQGEKASTLIGYLAEQIGMVAAASVDIEDLRSWIKEYPCALILDGLDEVPATANRTSVIRAINEFWDDAPNTDAMMIVTTRPQGYNDDLDPTFYSKLEMTPLKPDRAVACADKLAADRIIDPAQRQRVLQRLRDAAKGATTARLMISPLQVAIMLALIDQRGDAPTDRWSLFDKYFAVVLEREQGKSGPVGQAMRHWGRQIVAVHHRAGFLLHVEAEKQGNSEAYLTSVEFADLIRGQLSDEGYEDEELEQNTAQLVSGSTERLVLLVQREEDRFSFEVRSLQEFMAAAYLMTGREATVQRRLRTVANRTHWLHVFQIAASKCFAIADAEQYRDTIITLCRDFNENGSPIDRLLRTGSVLALALLDDGLAYDQPRYRRLLFFLALEILEAGPVMLPESLATHCDREPQRTIEKLRPYLSAGLDDWRRAAWKLVLRCAERRQGWAEPFLKEIWPQDPKISVEPLAWRVEMPENSSLFARMRAAIESASPLDARRSLLRSEDEVGRRRPSNVALSDLLLSSPGDELRPQVHLDEVSTAFHLRIERLQPTRKRRAAYENLPETSSWLPLRAVRDFHYLPSAGALADLLEQAIAQGWLTTYEPMLINMPWPLASLVRACIIADDPGLVVSQVREGAFGDVVDWLRAEERWVEAGITEADLEVCASGNFFDHRVAQVGLPWGGLSIAHGHQDTDWVNRLIELALAAQGEPRRWLIAATRFVLSVYPPTQPINVGAALDLLHAKRGTRGEERIDPAMLCAFNPELLAQPAILDRFEELGLNEQIFISGEAEWDQALYPVLIEALQDRPGLIVLLANLVAADDRRDAFQDIPDDIIRGLLNHDVPVVAGYARVISLAKGGGDEAMAREIFTAAAEVTDYPVSLLSQCLKHRCLTGSAPRLADVIAQAINLDPAVPHQPFMPPIQTIAAARVSDLHRAKCWSELHLGQTLFAQTSRRRDRSNLE